MKGTVSQARRAARRAVAALDRISAQLQEQEIQLSTVSGATAEEAGELAGLLGAVLIDRLRPAIAALRSVATGAR